MPVVGVGPELGPVVGDRVVGHVILLVVVHAAALAARLARLAAVWQVRQVRWAAVITQSSCPFEHTSGRIGFPSRGLPPQIPEAPLDCVKQAAATGQVRQSSCASRRSRGRSENQRSGLWWPLQAPTKSPKSGARPPRQGASCNSARALGSGPHISISSLTRTSNRHPCLPGGRGRRRCHAAPSRRAARGSGPAPPRLPG